MNFGFFKNLPWFNFHPSLDFLESVEAKKTPTATNTITDQPPSPSKPVSKSFFVQLRGRWFIQSIIPSTRKESKHNKAEQGSYASERGCALPLFRPYVSRVPWHKGARAFLSQLFPRYGHYCGPNWSSGKDNGSLLWDRRPIDWLDLCCYCHDIGYDTHDQAKLLRADLAFLECLEKSWTSSTVGDAHMANLYRTMCITGLKNILIPYRRQILRMHQWQVAERIRGNLDR